MSTSKKTLEFKFERLLPASPEDVFDAWMSSKTPGTIWNAAEKFLVDPKVDGLFYWTMKGTSHYGRFIVFNRPTIIHHTWVSPNTLGLESTVEVSFKKDGNNTRMTLIHSQLPDDERARNHEKGWNYFLTIFLDQFGDGARKPYLFEQAHPTEKPKGKANE